MTAADPQAAPSCSAPPPAAAAGAATDAERRQRQLAVLLLGGGRHQDALRVLQLLLARHPASPELLCLQGRCLAALGSRPQARKGAGGWRGGGQRRTVGGVLLPLQWVLVLVQMHTLRWGLIRAATRFRTTGSF